MRSPKQASGAIPLPADLSRLIIVGAGGFAMEVAHWARDAWPVMGEVAPAFVASEPPPSSRQLAGAYLGDPDTFEVETGDYFLLGIGVVRWRRAVVESLLARQARFLQLVHPTAIVVPTAALGRGTIVCPYAVVSDAAVVGEFGLLNYHSSLGHDSSTGRFAVLSPYASLAGNAHLGEEVFLGMHASVGPGVRLGHKTKVSANSCALSNAPAASLVYGVPGRVGYQCGDPD